MKEILIENESGYGKVPENADVKSSTREYSLRKITNGYIIKETEHINYYDKGEYGNACIVKETYSKESPVDIKTEIGKYLASNFE